MGLSESRPSTAGSNYYFSSISRASQNTNATFEDDSDEGQRSLFFHEVCGQNVRILSSAKVAKRANSFCYGIAFSGRPIDIGERVHIKLVKVEQQWSGVMRFGVTSHNPDTFRDLELPRYACPDLTNQRGFWAKALPDEDAIQNNIITFYVTSDGCLHQSINGGHEEVVMTGIDTSITPLWVIVDIYGNTTALEFLDEEVLPDVIQSIEPAQSEFSDADEEEMRGLLAEKFNTVPETVRRMGFTEVRGSCVAVLTPPRGSGNSSATKLSTVGHPCCGIVFSGSRLNAGESWLLHVQGMGGVSFGVTTCDPWLLPDELPADSEDLMDRLEYWVMDQVLLRPEVTSDVVTSDVDTACRHVVVSTGSDGWLRLVTESSCRELFHFDTSQSLWIIIDLGAHAAQIKSLCVYSGNDDDDSDSDDILAPDDSVAAANLTGVASTSSERVRETPKPETPARSECLICCDNPATMVIYDCGHVCLCEGCANTLRGRDDSPNCPICRKEIKDIIKIYHS